MGLRPFSKLYDLDFFFIQKQDLVLRPRERDKNCYCKKCYNNLQICLFFFYLWDGDY